MWDVGHFIRLACIVRVSLWGQIIASFRRAMYFDLLTGIFMLFNNFSISCLESCFYFSAAILLRVWFRLAFCNVVRPFIEEPNQCGSVYRLTEMKI